MGKNLCVLAVAFLALGAQAQTTIERPAMKPGDTWVYRNTTEQGQSWNQTHDELRVTRVTASSIFYTSKPTGGSQLSPKDLLASLDWARIRNVNGKETVVNRPLSFPLSEGKSWAVAYEEQHPNSAHKFERFDNTFTVLGYETVEVPAGKYKALKIESEGHWVAALETSQTAAQSAKATSQGVTMVTQVQKTSAQEATGKTYKAFWYVPEIKRWVKSVEEYYSSDSVRTSRYTQELESFHAAD